MKRALSKYSFCFPIIAIVIIVLYWMHLYKTDNALGIVLSFITLPTMMLLVWLSIILLKKD